MHRQHTIIRTQGPKRPYQVSLWSWAINVTHTSASMPPRRRSAAQPQSPTHVLRKELQFMTRAALAVMCLGGVGICARVCVCLEREEWLGLRAWFSKGTFCRQLEKKRYHHDRSLEKGTFCRQIEKKIQSNLHNFPQCIGAWKKRAHFTDNMKKKKDMHSSRSNEVFCVVANIR